MERRQQGEQMNLLNRCQLAGFAQLPGALDVCRRGAGRGTGLGLVLVLWLELRDKSIRNEADVLAALELPMLVSVPWIGAEAETDGATEGYWNPARRAGNKETSEIVEV